MSAARAHRALEFRALAGFEFQSQIHGMRNGQDVGEQNRGIERKAIDRLQRDFAGDLRIGAHLRESRRRGRASRGIRAGSGPPGASARSAGAASARAAARAAADRSSGAARSWSVHPPDRTAADAREWHSGRSCRQCNRRRRGRGPPDPAPVPAARRWPCARPASGSGSLKNASNSSRTTRRALAVMRRTL